MSTRHGINVDYMDRTANPGVDFNRFVNGTYIDKAVLPPGYPRWGTFLELRERVLNQVHALLEEVSEKTGSKPGSNERKIADLYASGMDEKQIEATGIVPLAGDLATIASIRSMRDLAAAIARLHQIGANPFFAIESMQDPHDSSQQIADIHQSGLGLPDRDYYLKDDAASVERRELYAAHIARMLQLLGENTETAQSLARSTIGIEIALAEASMPLEDMRAPNNVTHPMSVDDFENMLSAFPVNTYMKVIGAPAFQNMNVSQPEFFKALNSLLKTTPLPDIRAYLRWRLITAMAPYLTKAFVDEKFEFYGKIINGLKEQMPRWKQVVAVVNDAIGEAVGELYVARHFPPAAKDKALGMLENLKAVMRQALIDLKWMSDATKSKALEKLSKTTFKIGYPDKWEDYSALLIERDCYVGNIMRANAFAKRLNLAEIGKPFDRAKWYMTPQTVNAYASPQENAVVFPAAILQPPFFDFEADDACNYGGILVVIGHEDFHHFDDSGAQFDAMGNVKLWWREDDFAKFMERVERIRVQFGRFKVGNVYLKPKLVSGEALADLAGVTLAYKALQIELAKKGRTTDANGFTDEQRFFIAFGQLWAGISTPAYAEQQAMADPHPAGKFRVNGTVANLQEFADAFGLPADAPIMLPKEERCVIF
jgi:putative endopeptidase